MRMKSSRTRGNDGATAHHHHPWPAAGRNPCGIRRVVPPQVVPTVGCPWLSNLVCRGTQAGFHRCRCWRSRILARRLEPRAGLRGSRHSNYGRLSQHPAPGCRVRHRPADFRLHQTLGGHRTRRAAAVLLRALLTTRHRTAWHHDHRRHFQPRGNDGATAHHHPPWPAAGRNPCGIRRVVPPQVVPTVGCPWLSNLVCRGTQAGFHRCRCWRSRILARRLEPRAGLRGSRHSNYGRLSQHPAPGCRVRHRPADFRLHQTLGGHRTRRAAAVLLRALLAAGHRLARHHDHWRHFQPIRVHGDCRAVQLRADRLRQGSRLYGSLQLSHHGHHGRLPVPARRWLHLCQERHAQHRRRVRLHPRAWPIAGSVRRLRADPARCLGEDGFLPVSRLAAQRIRTWANGQHRDTGPPGHEGCHLRDAAHHGHGVFHQIYQ